LQLFRFSKNIFLELIRLLKVVLSLYICSSDHLRNFRLVSLILILFYSYSSVLKAFGERMRLRESRDFADKSSRVRPRAPTRTPLIKPVMSWTSDCKSRSHSTVHSVSTPPYALPPFHSEYLHFAQIFSFSNAYDFSAHQLAQVLQQLA